MTGKEFDLLALGEILLRLSPPNNERIVRGDVFEKQVGGAELNAGASFRDYIPDSGFINWDICKK